MAFRSFTFLSILVSAVLADDSSSSFIPSDITPACKTHLTSFDNNTEFKACTEPFLAALQQFGPSASSTPSSADITAAFSSLCQSNAFASCPQSSVTSQLGAFYAACSTELTTSPNNQVKELYDVLYALVPTRLTLCAKDDSGNRCATQLSNSGSNSQMQDIQHHLYTTTSNSQSTLYAPNTTTYQITNILFMFLQPDTVQCTPCTRNIITPWITFGSACPYAPGMNNSLLFSNELALFNSITAKCGSNFLSGAVQAAGGLSDGILSGGATPLAVGQELSAAVAAILGVAAFVTAYL